MIYVYYLLRILEKYFLDNVYLILTYNDFEDEHEIISGKGSKVFTELMKKYKYNHEFDSYCLKVNHKKIQNVDMYYCSFEEFIIEFNKDHKKKILNNIKVEIRKHIKQYYKKKFIDNIIDFKIKFKDEINKKIKNDIINEIKKEIKDRINKF